MFIKSLIKEVIKRLKFILEIPLRKTKSEDQKEEVKNGKV